MFQKYFQKIKNQVMKYDQIIINNGRHLSCFILSAKVNSAAVNITVYKSFGALSDDFLNIVA